jgi:hypothetical protein
MILLPTPGRPKPVCLRRGHIHLLLLSTERYMPSAEATPRRRGLQQSKNTIRRWIRSFYFHFPATVLSVKLLPPPSEIPDAIEAGTVRLRTGSPTGERLSRLRTATGGEWRKNIASGSCSRPPVCLCPGELITLFVTPLFGTCLGKCLTKQKHTIFRSAKPILFRIPYF